MIAIGLAIVIVIILINYYRQRGEIITEHFVKPTIVVESNPKTAVGQPGRQTNMNIGTRSYDDVAVVHPTILKAAGGVGIRAKTTDEMKKFYAGEQTRFDVL